MKSNNKKTHAAAGGILKLQLDPLMAKLQKFEVERPEPVAQIPRRLTVLIEQFRNFICGTFGVKREAVTDEHVGAFALRMMRDSMFVYQNFYGVGWATERELAVWAKQQTTSAK